MNKYLELAEAMRENRCDWSDGYRIVKVALKEFKEFPQSEEDKLIIKELEAIIEAGTDGYVDGRNFRDCQYNYDYLEENYGEDNK